MCHSYRQSYDKRFFLICSENVTFGIPQIFHSDYVAQWSNVSYWSDNEKLRGMRRKLKGKNVPKRKGTQDNVKNLSVLLELKCQIHYF